MKYVVLGAGGQLGLEFCRRLAGQAVGLNHAQGDLTNREDLRENLLKIQPRVVINCAAYTQVDRAEQDPNTALNINGLGVANLARICAEIDAVLVHFSTDYVFGQDSKRQIPYEEDDVPGPVNVYGHSKLVGEYAVRAHWSKHFLIRTCGLYGPDGTNIVKTMLAFAREGKPIRVVHDQVCCPTYIPDLVEASLALLSTNRFGPYHLTNAGACSWLEFARAIFGEAKIKAEVTGITSAAFNRPARRPGYSVLANKHCRHLGLPVLRDWKEALAGMLGGGNI